MKFNLGSENECSICKLEPISGGDVVELEQIIFTNRSVLNIADIMERGNVTHNNKKLVADIICKREDCNNLIGKRFKATLRGATNVGNDILFLIEFTLGNIEILFNDANIEFDDEYATIRFANITAYNYGKSYKFKVIED